MDEKLKQELNALISRLETYSFTCEAGSLRYCLDWQELKTKINA